MFDFEVLAPGAGRTLLVAGTRDTYCPVDALHRLAQATGAEERVIEGADHFFFGKLYPLGEAIGAWVAGAPPAR
jgi:alpha/beta superfamily hydrolase